MSPFARLCSFWFVFMGALGIFFPFFSLYLREQAGLSALQVGAVVSVLPLVGAVAQPLWGQLADRSGARSRVLALIAAGGGLAQLLLPAASGVLSLLAATALLAVFWTSVLPMALSVTLAQVSGTGRHAFGLARACGTLGFLVLVVAFPPLLRRFTGAAETSAVPPGLAWMFPAVAVLALAGAALALTLPREGAVGLRAQPGGLRLLLRHPPMVRVLVFVFVAYFFLNGPMQLFPLFVGTLGGGLDELSRMWVLMLLLEIPLVALSGTLLTRLGARGLLGMGVLAGGLRWSGSAFAGSLVVTAGLGLLHGVVVVGLTIGATLYVESTIPQSLRSTGQALLATVGVGLGGICSNLCSGWLFDQAGARGTYLGFGIGALVLGVMVAWVLPRPARAAAANDGWERSASGL